MRVPFHTADLTAAVNVILNCAVTYADCRSFIISWRSIILIFKAHHTLPAEEIVGKTTTAAVHVSFDGDSTIGYGVKGS